MDNAPIPAKRALAVLDNPPQAPFTDLPAKRISKKVRTAIGYRSMASASRSRMPPRRPDLSGKPSPAPCRSPASPSIYASGCCAIP
jgi:hypothetical protein